MRVYTPLALLLHYTHNFPLTQFKSIARPLPCSDTLAGC